MDEIKWLTDETEIAKTLINNMERHRDNITSTIEKHKHGEPLGFEEDLAKVILLKHEQLREQIESNINSQVISNAYAIETLILSIPFLLAENNRRILSLLHHT